MSKAIDIPAYTLVKCINSYDHSCDRYTYTFEKDQTYVIVCGSNRISVSVSIVTPDRCYTDQKHIRTSTKFVFDSTIYNAPQFDKHFEIIGSLLKDKLLCINGMQFNLEDIQIANDFSINSKRHFGKDKANLIDEVDSDMMDNNKIRLHVKPGYLKETSSYSPDKFIRFKSIKIENNEYVDSLLLDIDKKHVPTMFDKNIKSLSIVGNDLYMSTRSRDKKTIFTVDKSTEFTEDRYNASKILDTNNIKNLTNISVTGAFIDKLVTAEETVLSNCNIVNLEIIDNHKLDLYNCTITSCNKKMFSKQLFDSEYTLNIIELNSDEYVVSNLSGNLNRLQFTEYCILFDYQECIKHFNLDVNEVHELSIVSVFNKYSSDEKIKYLTKFNYHMSNTEKLAINITKDDVIQLMCDLRFSEHIEFLEEHVLILTKENEVRLSCSEYSMSNNFSIHDFNEKLINDNLLARLTKSLDNSILSDAFYHSFFNEPQLSKSKHIGEIDIKDFVFTMMPNHDLIVSIELVIDKQTKTKSWYMQSYALRHRTSYVGGERHMYASSELSSHEIDWANYAFSISTENCEVGTYFNPDYRNYSSEVISSEYRRCNRIIKIDNFYLLNNPMVQLKFDESKVFAIELNQKLLEEKGIMFLDNFAYYNDYNCTAFDEHSFLGHKNTSYCSVKEAEKLAKKYKIRLDIDSVREYSDEYYRIKTLLSSKCSLDKRKELENQSDYISDSLYFLGICIDAKYNRTCYENDSYWMHNNVSIQAILAYASNLRNIINMKVDLHSVFNVIVLIGNRYFMIDKSMGHYELFVNESKTDVSYKSVNAYTIELALFGNQGQFSVVNFDMPERLFNKVINVASSSSVNKLLYSDDSLMLSKQFGCTGLHLSFALATLDEDFRVSGHNLIYRTTDSSYKKSKEKLISLGTELRKHLLQNLTKAIIVDDVPSNTIGYDSELSLILP